MGVGGYRVWWLWGRVTPREAEEGYFHFFFTFPKELDIHTIFYEKMSFSHVMVAIRGRSMEY